MADEQNFKTIITRQSYKRLDVISTIITRQSLVHQNARREAAYKRLDVISTIIASLKQISEVFPEFSI